MSEQSPRLRKGTLSAVGAAVLSMAFMGPATSVYFNTPLAAEAGYALPLAIGLAMVVCLLVASVIASFARKLPAAGFAYTFNSHGLGRRGGFLSGWLLVFAYGMVGPMLLSALGGFTSDFVKTQFHWSVPWWVFTLAFGAIVWGISALGVSQSARTALIFLVLEVGVLLGLFAAILGKGGADGLSAGPFNPGSAGGIGSLGKGMLWGILMFIGFESAGTLGEEARSAKRSIPIALFTAVLGIGVFYVLAGYAAAIGIGQPHAADLSAGDLWDTLMKKYWGVGWLLTLTVLNSQFANLISGVTAQVRVVFAMGREGILPRLLGGVRGGVPRVALAAYMVFSLLATIVGGIWIGPSSMYGFAGTILGVSMVIVYILMSLALIRFYLREHRAEFSVTRHAVIPAVAALLLLLPLYGQLDPLPTGPNRVALILIVVWMAAGAAYLYWIERSRPQLLSAMGRVFTDDEEPAKAPA
jgi:amino acid transporter